MKELMIYRTWFQNRFVELHTSNEYDPEQPLELSLKTNWYRWGVEIELIAIKYSISFYIGYQHIHSIDVDENGQIMYEKER